MVGPNHLTVSLKHHALRPQGLIIVFSNRQWSLDDCHPAGLFIQFGLFIPMVLSMDLCGPSL